MTARSTALVRCRPGRSHEALRAAAALNLAVLASSCAPWVGPVHLRIETRGVSQGDFVIRPAKLYTRVERREEEFLEPRVVSSEEDLIIPRSGRGPTYAAFRVYAYHPDFISTYSGVSGGGERVLPPLRPERWTDYLEAHGDVSVTMTRFHLETMRESWITAFEPGAARERLQRYLPGLESLAARARLHPEDLGRFPTKESARQGLSDDLRELARMMR